MSSDHFKESEYEELVEKYLGTELNIDDPTALTECIVKVESLAYGATYMQEFYERLLRHYEREREEKLASLYKDGVPGKTAPERQAYIDKELAAHTDVVSDCQRKIKLYRSYASIIERRIGLAQSILANLSAQIKAGIR